MKNSEQMVMDDGHGQSMLVTVSSGPEVDLLGTVVATTPGGGATYSPYIGAIVDLAKEMENLHTAQYQYIPALALPQKEQLNLKLNNPPSFHKPMSVLSWKVVAPDDIQAKVSLADADPGTATLAIKQYGLTKPIEIPVHTYAEEGHLDQFTIHAGEKQGSLRGARLDLVASLDLNGTHFLPASLTRVEKLDELSLLAQDAPTSGFEEEQKVTAKVTLKDGRTGLSHVYVAQQESLGTRWFTRGVRDLGKQHFQMAVAELRTALLYSRDPGGGAARRGTKRRSLCLPGQPVETREPENGQVNLELARIAAQKGDTAQALRYYHNAIYATWPGDQGSLGAGALVLLSGKLQALPVFDAAHLTRAGRREWK